MNRRGQIGGRVVVAGRQATAAGMVLAEFLRHIEGGDLHRDRNGRLVDEVATPKTPRRPASDPRLTTGGADRK